LNPETGTNSRALIRAVRPFGRDFPAVAEASEQLRARVARKFTSLLDGLPRS
jgi:hypothetical protein